ncbi:hypothetical protein BQ8794_230085 [Mesorhizobium prunaredense]|uniref:Uncharacterized protein n=1 Tax=Mesorhizobium prunaredense TaxID=1631249 RepID=A0A1R3V789_9HYPH|nr:hypothetical protein BQ8794_230085 [Mesorhizobium prunaredense]
MNEIGRSDAPRRDHMARRRDLNPGAVIPDVSEGAFHFAPASPTRLDQLPWGTNPSQINGALAIRAGATLNHNHTLALLKRRRGHCVAREPRAIDRNISHESRER